MLDFSVSVEQFVTFLAQNRNITGALVSKSFVCSVMRMQGMFASLSVAHLAAVSGAQLGFLGLLFPLWRLNIIGVVYLCLPGFYLGFTLIPQCLGAIGTNHAKAVAVCAHCFNNPPSPAPKCCQVAHSPRSACAASLHARAADKRYFLAPSVSHLSRL